MAKVIKCFETIKLPEWSSSLEYAAKVDTGACTCSLHCDVVFEQKGLLNFKPFGYNQIIRTKNFTQRHIVYGNGARQLHYFVSTTLHLGNKHYENISFSLTNRQGLKFPVLIGRKFLRNNKFVVKTF